MSLAENYTYFSALETESIEDNKLSFDFVERPSDYSRLKETPLKEKFSHVDLEKGAGTAVASFLDHRDNAKSSNAISTRVKLRTDEILESEFYCIIRSVDEVAETIYADVYDIVDNVQVMDITANFSEFLESERNKIVPNASFYWRIGSRNMLVKRRKDNSEYLRSSVFSEFRMRLTYVSPRSLKGRLESKVQKHSSLFS